MQRTDDNVRFDDRLATVLQIDARTESGRQAIWWQLTAMLGQSGHEWHQTEAARALAAIASLSPTIAVETRVAAARAIAARCDYAPLAVLLSRDVPAVVTAVFDRLNLSESDWALILPDLSPLARSRLRPRRDLPASVHRHLLSLSRSDFGLPASSNPVDEADQAIADTAPPAVAPTPVGSPIAELVHRIEAYRNRQPANDGTEMPRDSRDASLAFATDADGCLRAAMASRRSRFVGVSLADVAWPGSTGVDAGVAAAFAKRDRIAAGRLFLAGDGVDSGLWAISAEPQFDQATGRFTGYRGSLSRDLGEDAAASGFTSPASTADRHLASAMQQMTHELRSPLNAISGFAQLIAGQYFGPVAGIYRDIASNIVDDAAFLTAAFEDIDLASRLDTGRFVPSQGFSTLAELLDRLESGPSFEDRKDEAVTLAVGCGDAQRLLRLVAQTSLRPADTSPLKLTALAVGAATVELVLELPASDTEGEGIDHMSLDIARRLAAAIGGSVAVSARKVIVNLPRLPIVGDRADIAG